MKPQFHTAKELQARGPGASKRVKPLISLVFDDGYDATFKNGLPILRKHKIRATFAVCVEPGQIEKSEGIKCARWREWKIARAQGHEIASHTITHRALTGLPLEQVEMELKNSARILGARSLIYPGGAYNNDVQKIARKFYICARGAEKGINIFPIYNFYALKSVLAVFRRGWRRWQENCRIKQYLRQTCREGGWLILSYHLIADQSPKRERKTSLSLNSSVESDAQTRAYKFQTRLRDFEKHLEWIEKYNLKVLPLAEAAEILKPDLSSFPYQKQFV